MTKNLIEERLIAIEERQRLFEGKILRVLWDIRGKNKGIASDIEKDLGGLWDEYLESLKQESPDPPNSTRTQ